MQRPSRRYSPRATCAAASRWWSGRFARDANARARSMRSSRAPRNCPAEAAFTALKLLLLAGAVAYLAVAGLVWLGQERLLFYPRAATQRPAPPPGWRLEEGSFTVADGPRLLGVLVLPPVERPPLVISFGVDA